MKRLLSPLALALIALACLPGGAQAAFGLSDFEVEATNEDGSVATQAGSHPFALNTFFAFNYTGAAFTAIADGKARDLIVEQPAGLVGDLTAAPTCSTAGFLADRPDNPICPLESVVGIQAASYANVNFFEDAGPIFLLPAPPGAAGRIGWKVNGVPVVVDLGVKEAPEHNAFAASRGINQTLSVFGTIIELWGVPADPAHDLVRGNCAPAAEEPATLAAAQAGERLGPSTVSKACPSNSPLKPFLTLPRSCEGPTVTRYEARSWLEPDLWLSGEHVGPQMSGCGLLGFDPSIAAAPTAKAATSPTGLDFSLNVADDGLKNPSGLAASDIRKTVVTLPEGMSVNPSQAEGLEVCAPAQAARESAQSDPGEGCPEASKIGKLEVETPLLGEEVLNGSLYIAEPYNNPFGSLLALYIVIKDRELGVSVVQPARVSADPRTGQLTTTADDLPQLPFSSFRLHFREGTRSPLVTPPSCGSHTVKAVMTPWSGGAPILSASTFQIVSGPDNTPCPKGGLPPFKPALFAGTLNNRAGAYSPFNLRMSRADSEQEITNFSIKLPPGVVGKLAGIPFCPDAAIAAAKARTGPFGGAEELGAPSCPAASEVGRSLAGSGVGPALTYVPGKLYLAGPYNGSALSLVSITAAKAGPFDLGTVVVRFALRVNPETAEVFVDATGSDPIPHIIQGIPVHLRDIRAYNDRPQFVLNPTNCSRTSTASTLLGAGLDFASALDDNPVTVSTPFQAADCAALPFRPKLALSLRGGAKRGANPALRAVLTAKPGEANIASTVVALPHSAFLDQSHIRTVCTRVQFRAEACPAGSIYGKARAITPLLDAPLEGPVYLRSSENPLPDLVAHLRNGQITIDLVGRVDSVDGGIRSSFESVPDAPVAKFVLTMQGGRKGLIVNSTNICAKRYRAKVEMEGQNGKSYDTKPRLGVKCAKGQRKAGGRKSRAGSGRSRAIR